MYQKESDHSFTIALYIIYALDVLFTMVLTIRPLPCKYERP